MGQHCVLHAAPSPKMLCRAGQVLGSRKLSYMCGYGIASCLSSLLSESPLSDVRQDHTVSGPETGSGLGFTTT